MLREIEKTVKIVVRGENLECKSEVPLYLHSWKQNAADAPWNAFLRHKMAGIYQK